MAKEPRETAVQKLDREWRELAIDSIDELSKQIVVLTERIHQGEIEAAVMKSRLGFIAGGLGFFTSLATTLIARWIMKS